MSSTGRVRKFGGKQLSLQHFLLQSSMVHAYRSAVRATRPLPDSKTRRETLDWMRGDLQRLQHITELGTLQSNLSVFQRTVKQLVPSLGLGDLRAEEGARLIGRPRTALSS